VDLQKDDVLEFFGIIVLPQNSVLVVKRCETFIETMVGK
jgi:hypothetical protein